MVSHWRNALSWLRFGMITFVSERGAEGSELSIERSSKGDFVSTGTSRCFSRVVRALSACLCLRLVPVAGWPRDNYRDNEFKSERERER